MASAEESSGSHGRLFSLSPSLLSRYYEDQIRQGSWSIARALTLSMGYGLIALRPYQQGETIFEETPVVAEQLVRNKHIVLSCGQCFKWLGSVNTQLDLLAGRISREQLASGAPPPPSSGCRLPELATACRGGREGGREKAGGESFHSFFSCPAHCGELFCSSSCLETAMRDGHLVLCTGTVEEMEHPIVQFKFHAIQSYELFLSAGKVFCRILSRYRELQHAQGLSPEAACEEAVLEFAGLESAMWWEGKVSQKRLGKSALKSEEEFQADMKRHAEISLGLLTSALAVDPADPIARLFTLEQYGRILGALNRNQMSIQWDSPVLQYVKALKRTVKRIAHQAKDEEAESETEKLVNAAREALSTYEDAIEEHLEAIETLRVEDSSDEEEEIEEEEWDLAARIDHCARAMEEEEEREEVGKTKVDQCCRGREKDGDGDEIEGDDAVDDLIERGEDLFPEFDGIGLFPLVAVMNHSCQPSCKVLWPSWEEESRPRARARVVALRPIERGEELLQSYIDADLPLERRRRRLLPYGFVCTCPKCKEEEKQAGT